MHFHSLLTLDFSHRKTRLSVFLVSTWNGIVFISLYVAYSEGKTSKVVSSLLGANGTDLYNPAMAILLAPFGEE